MDKAGIPEKVTSSDWAAPVVPVPKGDGRIGVCGDYKVTCNPYLEHSEAPGSKSNHTEQHPDVAGSDSM